MIRYLTIALVMFGLVAQPVVSAMPLQVGTSESSHSLTTSDQVSADVSMAMEVMPCHLNGGDKNQMLNDAACCETDCTAVEQCDVVCALSIVAIINTAKINLEIQKSRSYYVFSMDSIDDQSSIIFHPPKHS